MVNIDKISVLGQKNTHSNEILTYNKPGKSILLSPFINKRSLFFF